MSLYRHSLCVFHSSLSSVAWRNRNQNNDSFQGLCLANTDSIHSFSFFFFLFLLSPSSSYHPNLTNGTDVAVDWSDHALWWPQRNTWLTRTRSTLDQCGVQADALLHFTPMHKVVRIQLPDLRYIDTKVDMSVKCFSSIVQLCKELGIRHPEELSFARPLSSDHLKKNHRNALSVTSRQRTRDSIGPIISHNNSHSTVSHHNLSSSSVSSNHHLNDHHLNDHHVNDRHVNDRHVNDRHVNDRHVNGNLSSNSSGGYSPPVAVGSGDGKLTPGLIADHMRGHQDERTSTPVSHWNGSNGNTLRGGTTSLYSSHPPLYSNGHTLYSGKTLHSPLYSSDGTHLTPDFSISPLAPTLEARSSLLRPRSLVEKARLNSAWLDSSLSLYEQDVREYDLLLLRYKFYSFYDLNPKTDGSRINQIYEQAKWALLTEEIDCTEREMFMFAALHLQVNLKSTNPDDAGKKTNDDDIDAALNELQSQLEGTVSLNGHGVNRTTSSNMTPPHVPELADYLRFTKPRRFTLKATKKLYFVLRDTKLYVFKSREDRFGEPEFTIVLRGCEITPDVNLSQSRYAVTLEVPGQDGMSEYNLRFNSEGQYAKWLAAFRLAAKGRTMTDPSYETEVRTIIDFLSIQHPSLQPVMSASQVDINPDDFISPKYLRRMKSRNSVIQRILEAHANVKDLSFTEAKLHFIKAWQALPDFGLSLFIVKFLGAKKEVRSLQQETNIDLLPSLQLFVNIKSLLQTNSPLFCFSLLRLFCFIFFFFYRLPSHSNPCVFASQPIILLFYNFILSFPPSCHLFYYSLRFSPLPFLSNSLSFTLLASFFNSEDLTKVINNTFV